MPRSTLLSLVGTPLPFGPRERSAGRLPLSLRSDARGEGATLHAGMNALHLHRPIE